MVAVDSKHTDMVLLLLDKRANIEATDKVTQDLDHI
jgi:hypothetical protein